MGRETKKAALEHAHSIREFLLLKNLVLLRPKCPFLRQQGTDKALNKVIGNSSQKGRLTGDKTTAVAADESPWDHQSVIVI